MGYLLLGVYWLGIFGFFHGCLVQWLFGLGKVKGGCDYFTSYILSGSSEKIGVD